HIFSLRHIQAIPLTRATVLLSFRHIFSSRHIQAIPLTRATVLRLAVDIMGIWPAFIICWLLVEDRQFSGNELRWIAPTLAVMSALLPGAYAGAGLYAHNGMNLSITAKIIRILAINSAFFMVAGIILSGIGHTIAVGTVIATFAVSSLMLCVARVGAAVVRS